MGPVSFLQGETEAELRWLRPFQIHGAKFLELGFSVMGETEVRKVRISDNLIFPDARPGDRVRIGFLLGNVTKVIKAE